MSSVGPTLYRGSAEPTTGRKGDLWIDTTADPVIKLCIDDIPTWQELELGGGMAPEKTTTYSTPGSGNHTIVDGTWVRVTCVGAGGGGGGKGGTGAAYAGGGSGGATMVRFYKVSGTSLPYTVGTGGDGGSTSGSSGTAGGATKFDTVFANGGNGGAGVTTGNGAASLGGGYHEFADVVTTSIGSYTVYGQYAPMEGLTYGGAGGAGSSTTTAKYAGYPNPGFPSGVYAGTASQGGAGGCSTYGLGALSTVNQNALSGSGYGSGGGGAGSTTGTDYTGGSGAPGLIIVEEFGVW